MNINIKLNHIGLATESLQKSINEFKILGYKLISEIIFDEQQDVNVCFIQKDGSDIIELIEPYSKSSPIIEILNRNRGASLYHFCYESADFDNDIKSLLKFGFTKVGRETRSPAFNNKRIVFFL